MRPAKSMRCRLARLLEANRSLLPYRVQYQSGSNPPAPHLFRIPGERRDSLCRAASGGTIDPGVRRECERDAFLEILDPGAQLDFPGPGAALLAVQLQVALGDG